MAILKLPNEGDTHTGRIIGCVEVAGNFGPQIKFTFEGGDDLYLAKKSADGQLSRIPLAYAECVGETLTFSRDHNAKMPDKPYWSVKLATGAEKQVAAQPSKRLSYTEAAKPASGPSRGSIPEMDDFPDEDYGRSVQSPDGVDPYLEAPRAPTPHRVPTAPDPVAPVAQEKAKIVRAYLDLFAWMKTQPEMKDAPLDVVQSVCATVWIEWNKRGLVK